MIRIGNTRKIKRETFENSADAQAYFNELCQRRTDYPASVVLAERILVKKKFRIDFIDAYKELISDLKKGNYIAVGKGHCALTRQARAFLDRISSMFVISDFKSGS